jgi:uncharacterized membrane protein YqgA involved in biofilm formation
MSTDIRAAGTPTVDRVSRAAHQSFLLLRLGFTVLPIVFGLDKFANLLVDWKQYLAPWIIDIAPFSASTVMHVVGVVEIVAGLVVALKPRYGAWLVAAWLGGIILTLLTGSGWFDVALRDVGLLLAALTLARLAAVFDPPGLTPTLGTGRVSSNT